MFITLVAAVFDIPKFRNIGIWLREGVKKRFAIPKFRTIEKERRSASRFDLTFAAAICHAWLLCEEIFAACFVVIYHACGGCFRYSEIPKYRNLAPRRGQKTVRHSEIPNY
ncbi:MAG: hypothetical protein LBG83_00880 [Oscillospiraceae bacterium]|nr:hypothetical protein [Oscillospiraceae bacterium]